MNIGKTITITSGYRTDQQQKYLWDNSTKLGLVRGVTVAAPGSSDHNRGTAVDAEINGRPIGDVLPESVFAKAGLKYLPKDRVHITYESSPEGGGSSGPDYRQMAAQAATKYGVPADLFTAQINQESGFDPNAKSAAGALGIAQFMPATAKGYGINPLNPAQALPAAAKLMASLYKKYGSWDLALAAYNAGAGTVDAYLAGKRQLPTQTTAYVSAILGAGGTTADDSAPTSDLGSSAPSTPPLAPQVNIPQTTVAPPTALAAPQPDVEMPGSQSYTLNPYQDSVSLWGQVAAGPLVSPETQQMLQNAQLASGVPSGGNP